jgi:hypothetical protein
MKETNPIKEMIVTFTLIAIVVMASSLLNEKNYYHMRTAKAEITEFLKDYFKKEFK